jgi:hypothetical protein
LYGYENYSFLLEKEHTLSIFENRTLRNTFRPKREELTVGWKKLENG